MIDIILEILKKTTIVILFMFIILTILIMIVPSIVFGVLVLLCKYLFDTINKIRESINGKRF